MIGIRLRKKYLRGIKWNKLDKPNLVMLCGLPGSGKSVFAETLRSKYGYVVHSSDQIRKELFGDENSQEDNGAVFNLLHKRIKDDLNQGHCVVYDATNLNRRKRKNFLTKYLKGVRCAKYCYLIPTPYKKCLKNNKKRERRVPEEVVERMYKSFQVPVKADGFDEVFIDRTAIRRKSLWWLLFKLSFVRQHNPYHDFTIGKHCRKAYAEIFHVCYPQQLLSLAALMHDIGKKFCRQKFYNGEHTVCRFSMHPNVSAYMAFHYVPQWIYSKPYDHHILYMALLINEHDRLMYDKSSNAANKIIDEYGLEFYQELSWLRKADVAAQKRSRDNGKLS